MDLEKSHMQMATLMRGNGKMIIIQERELTFANMNLNMLASLKMD
jgi:hypothetical protein